MSVSDIYVALVDDNETFNPEVHNRRDLKIQDIRINKGDESSFWAAEIDIINQDGGPFRAGLKRRAIISELNSQTGQVEHILTGRLEGWPIGLATSIVTLNVVASGNVQQREALEDFALGDFTDDPWSLFARDNNGTRITPEERLSASYAQLNYNRKDTDAPVLVDLIEGNGFLNLGGKFIEGSLQFSQPVQPVTRVNVTITAEWLQSVLANFDVGEHLAPAGYFGTLNSSDWEDFPQEGERVGDWAAVKSSITPRSAPAPISERSASYQTIVRDNPSPVADEPDTPRSVFFNRRFYDLELLVAGVATARRKETVVFSVVWSGGNISHSEGITENINLSCRNLQGRYRVPEHQPLASYGEGQIVETDSLKWRCIEAHQSQGSIYEDFSKWDPVIINAEDPIGGSYADQFFSVGQNIIVSTPSGNQQTAFRNPAPGISAINYGLKQARAKILSTMRTVNASFDVPWHYVRHLIGTERIRISDASIPNGEMTGKLVSVSCSLVSQVATLTISAASGRGGQSGFFQQPQYASGPIGSVGIIRADIENDYTVQENILSANQAPANVDFQRLLSDNATRMQIDLAPIPRGGDAQVIIPLGQVGVDCDQMINLEG